MTTEKVKLEKFIWKYFTKSVLIRCNSSESKCKTCSRSPCDGSRRYFDGLKSRWTPSILSISFSLYGDQAHDKYFEIGLTYKSVKGFT